MEQSNFERFNGDWNAYQEYKRQLKIEAGEIALPNSQAIGNYWGQVITDPIKQPVLALEKNQVWHMLKYRAYILFKIKNKDIPISDLPRFTVNDANRSVIANLTNYALRANSPDVDLKKGFMLRGLPGGGKTFLVKLFADANGERHNGQSVHGLNDLRGIGWGDGIHFGMYTIPNIHSCVTIHHQFRRDGEKALDPFLAHKPMLFDDLGNEESSASRYGNRINVMESIICQRYDLFVNFGIKTYFTSNITDPKEIEEMYGIRVRDRLREMCNVWTYESNEKNHISFR